MCLDSLFASLFQDFEVIVVDDASTDRTKVLLGSYPGCKLICLKERGGPARARNLGAKEAKGEYLVFLDSDVELRPDSLSRLYDNLLRYDVTFGIYAVEPAEPSFATCFYHYLSRKSIEATREDTRMFYSYFAGMKRKDFLALGGFDEDWNRATFEDVVFGKKIKDGGFSIHLDKSMEVTHHIYYTPISLLRSYWRKSRDLATITLLCGTLSLGEGWSRPWPMILLASLMTGTSALIIACWIRPFLWLAIPMLLFFFMSHLQLYWALGSRKILYGISGVFMTVAVYAVTFLASLAGVWNWLERKKR